MNYPIPTNHQDMAESRQRSINEETIASAIEDVVTSAQSQGQSLEEVIAEVLADDSLLDFQQRQSLSEIVAVAWTQLSR